VHAGDSSDEQNPSDGDPIVDNQHFHASAFFESLEVLQLSDDVRSLCRRILRTGLQALAETVRDRIENILLFVKGKLLVRFDTKDAKITEVGDIIVRTFDCLFLE
jgi:hypothetical protein